MEFICSSEKLLTSQVHMNSDVSNLGVDWAGPKRGLTKSHGCNI